MPGRLLATALALSLVAACSDDDGAQPTPSPSSQPGDEAAASTMPATTPADTATTSAAATAPATTSAAPADPAAARVVLTPIAELDEPIAIAWRPGDDDTIYIAQQDGLVLALPPAGEAIVALDLTDATDSEGERGLLGLAFAADGRHAYLNYTSEDSGDSHVVEVPVASDGTLDRAGLRELLMVEQPYSNHNGGSVVVGPDGLLYLGFGDGGAGGDPHRYGLDLSTLLGKLLRIDPTASGGQPYTVPPDNPFVATGGARPEIWSFGLRNPWRFSFDRSTGNLVVADVGQDELEEISFAPSDGADTGGAGVNFGWSAYEGSVPYNQDQPISGVTFPIHEYPHGELGCSITGGYVYRGSAIPNLVGAYVFADYCASGIRAFGLGEDGTAGEVTFLAQEPDAVVTFGEEPDGELYVASKEGGVWRLDPA
jgi:glucose/arabinose dehydrogenase